MKHATYIRWLGAFRGNKKKYSLLDSIIFELSREDEVACEMMLPREYSRVRAKVGLLLAPSCIFRKFPSDCWSEYGEHKSEWGRLHQTRTDKKCSPHREAWAKHSQIIGIVIDSSDGKGLYNLRAAAREDVLKAVELYNLPLYKWCRGKLIKEEIKPL